LAGRIDVACFDKTGTLTAENLIVEGIAGLDSQDKESLKEPTIVPKETCHVLAAAHALAKLEDGIIGDPMEKNTLESIGWTVSGPDLITSKSKGQSVIKILRRFQFSSQLKRMSTLSLVTDSSGSKLWVAVKGAPETLQSMYAQVPKEYEETYKYWARRGKRVIALGYKVLDGMEKKIGVGGGFFWILRTYGCESYVFFSRDRN
jgi:cation-transporting ATPase 13A1